MRFPILAAMANFSLSLSNRRPAFVALGILLFLLMLLINPFGLEDRAAAVSAIAVLMITWWICEALPMAVVAMVPILLFPFMHIASTEEAAAPYANPVIFLFMGGFMIGLAIEKWNLHRRIALNIIKLTGTSGRHIVLGFILATGCLSMWLSNTATTMMMYPIAMSVISVMEAQCADKTNVNNFAICLLLSIAYASNLAVGTIIGTPPNVAYVAFLEKHDGFVFPFVDWMAVCMPLSILLLLVLHFALTYVLYPVRIPASQSVRNTINAEVKQMGPLTTPERRVVWIFALTAFLWIMKDLINAQQSLVKLDDTVIAIAGATLLFIVPANEDEHLLEWPDTKKMAWGILLLFGGGISLAQQLEEAGLIQKLGAWISTYAEGGFLLLVIITLASIFISEVMSNVAQVIVFAPVVAGIAEALHINAIQLGMAMTLGASCAGMLPMGTPPNAIVFASGRLKLAHMAKAGFVMNLVCVLLISLFCWYVLPLILPQ